MQQEGSSSAAGLTLRLWTAVHNKTPSSREGPLLRCLRAVDEELAGSRSLACLPAYLVSAEQGDDLSEEPRLLALPPDLQAALLHTLRLRVRGHAQLQPLRSTATG